MHYVYSPGVRSEGPHRHHLRPAVSPGQLVAAGAVGLLCGPVLSAFPADTFRVTAGVEESTPVTGTRTLGEEKEAAGT